MKKKIKKPFDVEAAKRGARIETVAGHSVRIICYDSKANYYPIVGLISCGCLERVSTYTTEGRLLRNQSTNDDLVIVEEVECPKFNPGDWVVDSKKNVRLITAVTLACYEVQDLQGNMSDIPHRRTIDDDYHIWTLKDAKPGDVLIDVLGHPFIYKSTGVVHFPAFPVAYCGITEEGHFKIAKEDDYWTDTRVKPATKEQRDRLFKKMEEEGYKWESDSLTLSKIPKRWADDKEATVKGYFIEASCQILSIVCKNCKENYDVFATEELAKSALAMARISQIMINDLRFGGPITDKEWYAIRLKKFVIRKLTGRLTLDTASLNYNFLAFHTADQRQLFLKENERLVKDYLMLK